MGSTSTLLEKISDTNLSQNVEDKELGNKKPSVGEHNNGARILESWSSSAGHKMELRSDDRWVVEEPSGAMHEFRTDTFGIDAMGLVKHLNWQHLEWSRMGSSKEIHGDAERKDCTFSMKSSRMQFKKLSGSSRA